MKNKLHLKFVLALALMLISINSMPVKASSLDTENVSLRPAIVDLFPTQTFDIFVKNNTTEFKSFNIVPSRFKVDLENRKVVPEFLDLNLNLDEFFTLSTKEVSLNPNEEKSVSVEYTKSDPNFILGVTVSEKPIFQANSEIGTTLELVSLFLDRGLDDSAFAKIDNNLDIKSAISVGNISFDKTYKIKSLINNKTSNFLSGSGEVVVKNNETNLANLAITQKLPTNIYPSEEISIETDFVDNRSILGRIGVLTFEQKFVVNGKEITSTQQVITIPIEILLIFVIIILLIIFTLAILKRTQKANKKMFRKPTRRKLRKQSSFKSEVN